MEKHNTTHTLIIGLCITLAGMSIGYGFYKGRSNDRYVTVKGLAEKDVDADLAIWPITFKVGAHDLNAIQKDIRKSRSVIKAFLLEQGLDEKNISFSAPQISDTHTETTYGNQNLSAFRYTASASVIARSTDVALIKSSMEKSGDLVGQGVILSAQNWQNPTEFKYTNLNSIKPAMIEEATKNAREAANKFAKDSGSRVGKIRNATQGYFSITDRDQNSPELKQVRVVTTVQYYLVD